MSYTFKPKQKFAKAHGTNLHISTKTATKICRVIRNKKLTQVKRLLNDLLNEKRSLRGKYHTKTVKEIKMLLEGCEKNAEFLGLNMDALFVHASAHQGNIIRRRRRKAAFGSRMKSTNLEIMLIEKGEVKKEVKKKDERVKEATKEKVTEKAKKEVKQKETKEEKKQQIPSTVEEKK